MATDPPISPDYFTAEADAAAILAALTANGFTITTEPCCVPSSVTGQPCLLAEGHPQDSPDRFHRYAPPIEDASGLLIDGLVLLIADAKARKAANPESTSDVRITEAESLIRLLANGFTIAPVAEAEAGRAVLAALEEYPDWSLSRSTEQPTRYFANRERAGHDDYGEADTLPAAIAAALQDEEGRT